MQDWLEALKSAPEPGNVMDRHAHDMLQVRSRDVLEHIERMVHHVRRLEQNVETAVQMHFNAQSHRANEIMRTLTVLTAVFLPLNLIAGIFGMNFEFIPLLHRSNGFWLAMAAMALTATALVAYFWRKRYLERSAR
jgi:Mg2+ and Co2+ transporter CorA